MESGKKFDDFNFIDTFRKGDIDSLNCVYDDYAPVIYGIIRKEVVDERVASEILCCVFEVAFRDTTSLDPLKQRLFTWLYNICFQLLHSHKPVKPGNNYFNVFIAPPVIDFPLRSYSV